MKKIKKPLVIVAAVAAGLVLCALILGVINGLFGSREWFGWVGYVYDDRNWEMGSGSVHAESVSGVNLDWIDGNIRIIACDDRFPSLTEGTKEGELSDSLMLRWTVDANGILQIRYRASALWHPVWQSREKELILRLPREMAENMDITVKARGANVFFEGIKVRSVKVDATDGNLSQDSGCAFVSFSAATKRGKMLLMGKNGATVLQTKHGDIRVEGVPAAPITITTKTANVYFILPRDGGVSVTYRAEKGSYISDLPVTDHGQGVMTVGKGSAGVSIDSESGKLYILATQE